jgi:hypothetical protein
MSNRALPFGELRRFLEGLGYVGKRADNAWVFHQAGENLLVFRLYNDTEPVHEGDLRSTRMFLDMWGILAEEDFDAFIQEATRPA